MTTHPTDDELQTWADGEASDLSQAAAWEAHVAQCSACAARVDAVRSLGAGLRVWAEAVAPEVAHGAAEAGLADRVMAAAKASQEAPATTVGAHGDRTATDSAPRAPARVVPLRARQRWAWGAVPIVMAAAAAMVFAIVRPVRPRAPTGGAGTPSSVHDDARTTATVAAEPTPLEDLAANVDPGSAVLSVDGPDDHSSYSVLEIHVKKFGTPVAVVWIDDRADEGPGAVQ